MLARWALLLLACVPVLAAFGAMTPNLQPSALRLLVAVVVGWLAPLFWPGLVNASLVRNGLRLGAWCLAALALAALGLVTLGRGTQRWVDILGVCAMLLPILLLGHLLAAAMQAWQRAPQAGAAAHAAAPGRGAAGAAMLALALLGAAPLWLGPVAELLTGEHPGIVDALVAASPVTHLAVASGLDILRNPWLYQNSNLAALPVNYPEPALLAQCYALACFAGLAALAVALRRQGRETQILDSEKP